MKIGRYEVIEKIGQGAMGTVYKALDPLIERTVAIKTVAVARLKEEGAEFEARFLREAQSAGRLSHPNIVTIYDVGETDEVAYIAMEYLSGPTLREIMDQGPMPPDLVLQTALQMAEALAFAHEHGVIHRDVKPSNVIITSSQRDRIKLTDFGIAHLSSSDVTQTGLMLGSPRYMSPEQAMGREVDGRTDIFSLGAVLYEMASGNHAFDGDNLSTILFRVINVVPDSLAKLQPSFPPSFGRIIRRMLEKQAHARYDARGLIEELRKLEQAPPAPPGSVDSNRVPRSLAIIAFSIPAAVFLLIALGIMTISHFLGHTSDTQSGKSGDPRPTFPPISNSLSSGTNLINPASEATSGKVNPEKKPQPAQTKASQGKVKQDAYLLGLEQKQVALELKKTELLLKYTPQHPDVILINRQLEQLNSEREKYRDERH